MQKSLSFSSPAPNPALPKFQYKTTLKKPNPIQAKSFLNSINSASNLYQKNEKSILIPTMPEIMAASKAQNLNLQLQTLGPFFRVSARSLKTGHELGRAEGLVRVWFGGRILHLDSIRLRRENSAFGLDSVAEGDLGHAKIDFWPWIVCWSCCSEAWVRLRLQEGRASCYQ